MTATLPTRTPEQLHLDGRDLELLVTMRLGDNLVVVEHQAGDNDRANRAMARLAAEIDHQLLGDQAPTLITQAPDPGRDTLMCRCGHAVDTVDLRWIGNARNSIRRVGCPTCAEAATW